MLYSHNIKSGVLGDKNWHKNCHEYHAFSTGFANATFNGQLMNPYLNGVKTPKYQRSAPRGSADVEAVNNSRFMSGPPSINAARLLKGYIDEAKAFSPPPVNIPNVLGNARELAERLVERGDLSPETADESYDRLVASVSGPIRRAQITENRGDAITKQTISDEALNPVWDKYLERFTNMLKRDKMQVMTNMLNVMRMQGINPDKYEPQLKTETGISKLITLLRTAAARGARINLDEIFMMPTEQQVEWSDAAALTALAELDYALAEEEAKQLGVKLEEIIGPIKPKRSESMQTKTGTSETASDVIGFWSTKTGGGTGRPTEGIPLSRESALATKGQQK